MTREDLAWISDWAKLSYTSQLTPSNPLNETLLLGGKKYACERQNMLALTIINPPIVAKQTIEMKGLVWRAEDSLFGVVRAEWIERTTKKDKVREESKVMQLIASGQEPPPTDAIDRGREFSVWRLIFGR